MVNQGKPSNPNWSFSTARVGGWSLSASQSLPDTGLFLVLNCPTLLPPFPQTNSSISWCWNDLIMTQTECFPPASNGTVYLLGSTATGCRCLCFFQLDWSTLTHGPLLGLLTFSVKVWHPVLTCLTHLRDLLTCCNFSPSSKSPLPNVNSQFTQ